MPAEVLMKLDPADLMLDIAKLADDFDLDVLLPELVKLAQETASALRDGKLSTGEAFRLGSRLLRVVKLALKAKA